MASYTTKKRCPSGSRTIKKYGSGARKCGHGVTGIHYTSKKKCPKGTKTMRKFASGNRKCGTIR